MKFCQEEDDELREYCLQAFESFVRRCPKEISSFVTDVSILYFIFWKIRCHRGRDRMVVGLGFTTTCAISVYHH
jgi:hypothetical protein